MLTLVPFIADTLPEKGAEAVPNVQTKEASHTYTHAYGQVRRDIYNDFIPTDLS